MAVKKFLSSIGKGNKISNLNQILYFNYPFNLASTISNRHHSTSFASYHHPISRRIRLANAFIPTKRRIVAIISTLKPLFHLKYLTDYWWLSANHSTVVLRNSLGQRGGMRSIKLKETRCISPIFCFDHYKSSQTNSARHTYANTSSQILDPFSVI